MNQKTVWDKIAPLWNKYKTLPSSHVKHFLRGKKGKVLYMGCGSGRNFINKKNITYYGVDFSEQMLELAEQNASKKNIQAVLFKSNLNKLPFDNNFFDTAIYINALHCITSKKAREDSLKELYRTLKKGKQTLITIWNKNQKKFKNKTKNHYVGFNLDEETGEKVQRYYYLYDQEEITKLLKKIGFKIKDIMIIRSINIIVEK